MKNLPIVLLAASACAMAGTAPEIDPGAGTSAVATVAGAILLLRSRISKRRGR